MTVLKVEIVDPGENAVTDFFKDAITNDTLKKGQIGYANILGGGMQSGKPSISFGIKCDDGTVVFAETSGELLNMLYAAYKGAMQKWGLEKPES